VLRAALARDDVQVVAINDPFVDACGPRLPCHDARLTARRAVCLRDTELPITHRPNCAHIQSAAAAVLGPLLSMCSLPHAGHGRHNARLCALICVLLVLAVY